MRAKNINDKDLKKVRSKLHGIYRDVLDLMICTGLRVGDAVSVKFGDLDEKGYIHYKARKTGKTGRCKLPDYIYNLLVKRRTGDGFVFPSPVLPGEHISRQAVWKNIKKACKECGVNPDGISPHSCRKRFAVKTYEQEGLGKTMASLQHNSPTTTFLYVFDDNPLENVQKQLKTYENELKTVKKQLKTVKKQLKKLLYAIDLCCDKLIGDDSYGVTEKGREILNLEDFFENT